MVTEVTDPESARKRANEIWDGLYLVRRGVDPLWQVTLHGPDGPVHWLGPRGEPMCKCCYRVAGE